VTQLLEKHELLERDAEIAAVRGLVDAACSGSGRALVVEARSGLGKTRLLGEARAIAAEVGLTVLSARGSELEREFSYGVVRQLLEPPLAAAGPDERAQLLSGAAALAAPLFDQLPPEEEPGSDEASLDPGDWELAWQAGRALSLDEAVAVAQEPAVES
jgi:hypothetical protein